MAAETERDLEERTIRTGPPVMHDQAIFGPTELAARISRQNLVAVAAKA